MKTVQTQREWQMKQDGEAGLWHDYDGCLQAYNAGRPRECFCLEPRMFKAHQSDAVIWRRARRPN